MTVREKAKENPLLAGVLLIFSLAGASTGGWAAVKMVDRLHTTESELLIYDLKAHTFASGQFDDLEKDIAANDATGKCRWLKSEIRALKDSIYVRRRDDADPDFIHSLEQDLEELADEYSALGCAKLLA